MDNNLLSKILELSVDERIALVQDIWDSIADETPANSLTEGELRELDRRLDEADANPGVGTPWSEIRDRLLRSG